VSRDLAQALAGWLAGGVTRIGQVTIRALPEGFELRHHQDAGADALTSYAGAEQARYLANLDDAGAFRPLKTAPNLRHGWSLTVPDLAGLRRALDYFYPAMLGVLRSHEEGALEPVFLRETLGRQSGMYAVTKKITDEQADALIGSVCRSDGGCLKTILWRISAEMRVKALPPAKFDPAVDQLGRGERVLPMLCHEACNLLVAQAREVVKKGAAKPA
jgi:sirohydrochlorin cobaltochelatase